jgi:hypothetical protein
MNAIIEQVEKTRAEDKPDGYMKKLSGCVGIYTLKERTFENLERRRKPTEQIPNRHQIWEQINLWIRFAH